MFAADHIYWIDESYEIPIIKYIYMTLVLTVCDPKGVEWQTTYITYS
jgi:hypothetical protein